MEECSRCKSAIRGETGIKCSGVCNKVYHTNMKCSGIDQYSINVLNSNGMIKFICDECILYIHNVDIAMREIHESVDKNKENLREYKYEFEASLKNNESEIKKLLEAIEIRYEERLKSIYEAQKSCENNVKEVKQLLK